MHHSCRCGVMHHTVDAYYNPLTGGVRRFVRRLHIQTHAVML